MTVRPGTISVELLRRNRKLNSGWKFKPRDGKNKDGEREQDKREVRGCWRVQPVLLSNLAGKT